MQPLRTLRNAYPLGFFAAQLECWKPRQLRNAHSHSRISCSRRIAERQRIDRVPARALSPPGIPVVRNEQVRWVQSARHPSTAGELPQPAGIQLTTKRSVQSGNASRFIPYQVLWLSGVCSPVTHDKFSVVMAFTDRSLRRRWTPYEHAPASSHCSTYRR